MFKWLKYSTNISYDNSIYTYGGHYNYEGTIHALQSNICAAFLPYNPDGSIVQYVNQLAKNSPIGAGRGGHMTAGTGHNSKAKKYITISNQIDITPIKSLVLTVAYDFRYRDILNKYRNNTFEYSRQEGVYETFTSGSVANTYQEVHGDYAGHNLNIFGTYSDSWDGHNFKLTAGGQYETYRSAQVDIDLGPDPVQETDLAPEPEEPLVGPGGTFGMFPPKDVRQPAREPAQDDSEFETPILLEGDEEPAPELGSAEEPQPETVGGSDLDDLVQRAMGAASASQMTPAAVVAGKNDQMMIAPAAAEQQVYHYPPLSLFERTATAEDAGVEGELKKNAELLVSTLESFGVRTRVLDSCRGPSVTRYELQPLAGVKISRITGLADDIALNLAAGGVRIEAPIPGKPAVGVEVPNRKKSPVGIRSIFESPVYSKSASPLTLALGKDIAGNAQIADLCKMPHLLIAGSTGSGKSVCVNSIIISFLYKASPEDVRLILIDPKVVELAEYNGIPHLLMPVVTEPRKAAGALGSAVAEMERRYHLFAENNVRDIKSYNRLAAETDGLEKLPYIAIIIDELADLMMVAGKEVEDYICRIAQKARAAGMHLIVATQRPSVDVITGLIKANIPSRIAFAVSSQVDSRTILDAGGAEKLLGMGDMLFMPVGAAKPVRIQGTYVKDEEISAVLDFIKQDEHIDEQEKDQLRQQLRQLKNGDPALCRQLTLQIKDGSLVPFELRIQAVWYEDGQLAGYMGRLDSFQQP